jgi:phage gp36-like protein
MTQPVYATAINLRDAVGINELVQVATPENASGLLNPATLSGYIDAAGSGASGDYLTAYNTIMDALTRASALIDSRLRSIYKLPLLPTIPSVLQDYCVAIARFYLHNDQATDEIRYRYEAAIADLNAIALGKINIGATDSGTTTINAGFGIALSANCRDTGYAKLAPFANVGPAVNGIFNGYCR